MSDLFDLLQLDELLTEPHDYIDYKEMIEPIDTVITNTIREIRTLDQLNKIKYAYFVHGIVQRLEDIQAYEQLGIKADSPEAFQQSLEELSLTHTDTAKRMFKQVYEHLINNDAISQCLKTIEKSSSEISSLMSDREDGEISADDLSTKQIVGYDRTTFITRTDACGAVLRVLKSGCILSIKDDFNTRTTTIQKDLGFDIRNNNVMTDRTRDTLKEKHWTASDIIRSSRRLNDGVLSQSSNLEFVRDKLSRELNQYDLVNRMKDYTEFTNTLENYRAMVRTYISMLKLTTVLSSQSIAMLKMIKPSKK